jgi:GT2 family glycosyltransferase
LRVRYELPGPPPLVSIIIPTRNGIQLLRRCISSIREKTTYGPYEIIVVDNQSTDPETLAYLDGLKSDGIADILSYDAPFNYSAINNHAVRVTRGALLCLLNNDIEVIGADWLGEMVSQAIRPEIGAVGALLYYPDDTIQHAGVIVGLSGCADHLYAGAPRGTKGMMGRACVVQNLSAVTAACLVIRKDIYTAVGGFDESNLPVSFNDVDFCLRVLERGYRNLWTPFAELYHHESATRGREHALGKLDDAANEEAYLRERWPRFMERDPAYNPNLTLGDKWPRQGADPRIRRPWLVD